MKKALAVIILVGLLATTGCGQQQVDKPPNNILTIHINDNVHSEYAYVFSAFKSLHPGISLEFDYADTRIERQKIGAEMMAGAGPDVVFLSNDGTFTDINKAIESGAFVNLEQYLQDNELSRSNFYEPLLDPCERDGELTVIPLKFSLPMLITTQETLDNNDIIIKQGDGFNKITTEIIAFGQRSIDKSIGITAILNKKLQHHTFPFMDWLMPAYKSDATSDLTHESYQLACDAFKATSNQFKRYGIWGATDAAQALTNEEIVFDMINWQSQQNIFQIIALLSDTHTPVLLPISSSNKGYAARIDLSVAINANAKNKDVAYDLIKLMATYAQDKDSLRGNHTIRTHNEQWVTQQKAMFDNGYLFNAQDAPRISPPSPNVYQNLLSLYEQIDGNSVYFDNDNNEAFFEKFQPYFDGASSFDDCFDTAQSAMEIYISE